MVTPEGDLVSHSLVKTSQVGTWLPFIGLNRSHGHNSNFRGVGTAILLLLWVRGQGVKNTGDWHSSVTSGSVQFSLVAQSCPTPCNPMNRSTPGLPVHHQLQKSNQTHVHRVDDAIQPPHPLSSPSPSAPNPSQHQGLFQWVSSLHQVAKVLEFQLQHQSFQWTPRTDLL